MYTEFHIPDIEVFRMAGTTWPAKETGRHDSHCRMEDGGGLYSAAKYRDNDRLCARRL